ncbi:MAG TPA: hypothetical protein DCG75_02650 [Bacteroidales bacterium]|nr:hypothetical protein [Bacteroidales bacterium]
MIRIQEHINNPNADLILDAHAVSFWNYLNKKSADGSRYLESSLIRKIESKLAVINSAEYKIIYADNDLKKLKRQKAFYNFLLQKNHFNLKRLIVSRPIELEEIKNEIDSIIQQTDYKSGTSVNSIQTKFGSLLAEDIFNYKSFRKSTYCRQLVIDLGLQHATCPYCNDNKIDIIDISTEDDNEKITKAYLDLDHFMPKSQNPFFALSFFNLIPSCHSCNSSEKGDKPFTNITHTNPYYKCFNDQYFFKLHHKCVVDGDFGIENPIQLELINGCTDKNGEDLRIHQRYKNGNYESALKLVRLYKNHQDKFDSEKLKIAFKELLLQDTPLNKNEILKYSLGKLKRDIIKQIDIHNLIK